LSRRGGLYQRMWEVQTQVLHDPAPSAS
jgi:hypothetical protein